MAVNRANAIPLYHQIFLTLRDEILRGDRPFGSSVPTEHELIEMFSVSRITARRALDELAQMGLVKRRRRHGTEVVYRSPSRAIDADVDQAVEALIAFGHGTKVRVIEHQIEAADPAIAARLKLKPGENVVRSARMRLKNGEPLGLVDSYLPASLQNAAPVNQLTEIPMLELLRKAGVTIGAAFQTIEALPASAELAETLQLEPRAPLLRIERLVENDRGEPVLLTVAHYRADKYRLTLHLHRSNRLEPSLDQSTAPSARKKPIRSPK